MQLSSIPGPDNITRVVFDNGLTVLVRPNHAAPVAVLQGSLLAGAMHETPQQAGLAMFTAGLLSRGSAQYDYAAFNAAIENVGGNLSFGADAHTTDFGVTCLSEDFAGLVAVLADALRRPTFPAVHVERVRQQRLVDLQEREEDTASVATLRFYEQLIGRQHPYGRATTGYRETVQAITRDDLVRFHAERYTPRGAVVVVTGDVAANAAVDLLHARLGDWQGPEPERALAPIVARRTPLRHAARLADKVQADIVLGALAVARSHPDFFALRVANCILGQFGLMGRLGERVREEQGLAYYVYSSVMAEHAGGVWSAAAGVNPANVEQALASILAELRRLGEEPVPPGELADSQAYLTGILPLTLETNEGVAATLLNIELYGLGLDYLLRYHDLVCAVTAEDVQRVAHTYLQPERLVTVIAGPEVNDPGGPGGAG